MKKELWLIFLIVFIGLLGFGIVIPTLPFIAKKYGANSTTIGLLFASYSFFQFFASPVLGRLSDKYGRKPLLALSLFGTAIGYYMLGSATTLWMIFASRIIDGITGGNISVAQAYIADVTEGHERTKAMGLIGASFGLGFMFGPFIGGTLSTLGIAIPYYFAAFLSFANCILIMLVLPESEKKSVQRRIFSLFSRSVLKEIFQPIAILYLTILFFITTFAFSLLQGTFPLFTSNILRWGEQQNGWFFGYFGFIFVITQSFLIRVLLKKFEETRLIQFGMIILAVSLALFTFAHNVSSLFGAATLMALGFGLTNTNIQAEISLHSRKQEQGIVLGTVQGLGSLARTVGPVIGGLLIDHFTLITPYLTSSIIMFLGFILSLIIV